jgi:SP family general alpha glucoside:H+ symporter-like MFS transporter
MSWSIGMVIVAGATYGLNKRDDQWSWRIPLALQWIFPVRPSFPILYLRELTRPDPTFNPRFLRARIAVMADKAMRSIRRLGRKSTENVEETLKMMARTVEIEAKMGGAPTLLDLFKGTDLRRTIVACLMYVS